MMQAVIDPDCFSLACFKPINHGCYPIKWLPDTLIKDSGLEEYVAGADDDEDY